MYELYFYGFGIFFDILWVGDVVGEFIIEFLKIVYGGGK